MFKLCLALSLIGILLLAFISQIEPAAMKISELNEKQIDSFVKTSGTIKEIQKKSTIEIITISDKNSEIEIILSPTKIKLDKDDKIQIVGKLSKYKSRLQIQATKIKLVK